MLRRRFITLDITVLGRPEDWDWHGILDLEDNESVEVVNVEEIPVVQEIPTPKVVR